MKILDQDLGASSTFSYAGLIEKIEILRSALRWASKLERPEIEKLLRQAGALRDEVMQLSHKERFVMAAAAEPVRMDLSRRQRREGLIERSFVEVRRRVRPMTLFSTPASSDRILFAIFVRLNEGWRTRPLQAFTQKA